LPGRDLQHAQHWGAQRRSGSLRGWARLAGCTLCSVGGGARHGGKIFLQKVGHALPTLHTCPRLAAGGCKACAWVTWIAYRLYAKMQAFGLSDKATREIRAIWMIYFFT
jgi:hypothetical protein